ncbi:hypothetical protein [Bacillus wiedmannii]|uniref:hypothetical protein n=1 Tax=Bacillus wiedmannii TaxID=1890302 RepID=UPI0015D4BCB0|nr:hypothetical protein [Bacillus wiedmannii]
MTDKSKYVEVRFKLSRDEFEAFEQEAIDDGWRSTTALITAEARKQARVKMKQRKESK